MKFEDIIGQVRAKADLTQLAKGDRLPHAMLLLGPAGSGALALAVAFAQLLQCEQKDAGFACGTCSACKKAAAFTHPDIHFSFPTIGANAVSTDFLKDWRTFLAESPYASVNEWLQQLNAENKQGNITKEECNSIIKKLSLKAFEGRYKILLMWLPEYLGKEGNRLLKLIEEPPDQTLFILVAENQELILPTILSRCQLIRIDPLSDEEVVQGLVAKLSIPADRAGDAAFLAGGDFGAALKAVESQESDHGEVFLDWLRKCWKGNAVELVKWTESAAQWGRENQKQFLVYGLHFLRELLLMVASGSNKLRLRPEELISAQNMSKVLDFEKIQQISELFNDGIFHIERNASPKIMFLDLSIQVNRILKK
ncbi:MAG: hypothetical protein JNJ57_16075 [Saprospiraceae bacterium]|nr:hypothetical protein [Saprospiraceae bacterium]